MKDVITRRGVQFYCSVILGGLALCGLSLIVFVISIDEHSWSLTAVGVAYLLCAYYIISRYYRNAPIVSIGYAGFTCKGKLYSWADVSTIKLTGNQPFNMFGGKAMEGTRVELKDGSEIILLDSMYSNLGAVRQAIVEVVPELAGIAGEVRSSRVALHTRRSSSIPVSDTSIAQGADGIYYVKGNSILNMYGIFALIFVIGSILAAIGINEVPAKFVCLLFGFGLLWGFSRFINYIGIANEFIVVRNVYRP